MTWAVLLFLLSAVFALGFHLGQKMAAAEAGEASRAWARDQRMSRDPALALQRQVIRRSL